jgi:hypothetical protein
MNKIIGSVRIFLGLAVISTLLIGTVPARGQQVVQVSDITGGSSVFVFRTGSKAAPRKFVTLARTER